VRASPAVMLLAVVALIAGCAHPRSGDRWLARDKFAHAAVSGAIAAGTAEWSLREGYSAPEARARAMLTVVLVGAGKQTWDAGVKPRGFWSWKDMAWNVFGGLLGGLAVTATRD